MRRKFNKAFTIVEMLVAIGLLAAMMLISTVVFRAAIDAQRKANAAGSYMRDLRAVVQRLEEDFSSMDLNSPMAVWFNKDGNDKILFFASGQFEDIGDDNISPSHGASNYGVLHYGVGNRRLLRYFKSAARYQDILPDSEFPNDQRDDIRHLLDNASDITDADFVSLSGRIESFKVQLLYTTENGYIRWFPDADPYRAVDGDSDFMLHNDSFGAFFNILDAQTLNYFYPPQNMRIRLVDHNDNLQPAEYFEPDFKPQAVKFTITINDQDSNLGAKTFTHIVKLGI